MSWLARLFRRLPERGAAQREALNAYTLRERPDLRRPFAEQRMVVVDVETSGLNPFQDRLISIGAVTVSGGLVRFGWSFKVVLRQARPSEHDNILVHGIGGSAQLEGREPSVALLDFLAFAGKDPLVAFRADFDRVAIERAMTPVLGVTPENAWLDLAQLAPALFPRQAGAARSLDDWLQVFGIENYARHDAVADALATAQLLLVALAAAQTQGIKSCAELIRLERAGRWLGGRRNV